MDGSTKTEHPRPCQKRVKIKVLFITVHLKRTTLMYMRNNSYKTLLGSLIIEPGLTCIPTTPPHSHY